jgi:hypothetical protein
MGISFSPKNTLHQGSRMTDAERIKLTILLHQHTPAERLSSMEISAMLQFMEQRDYLITAPTKEISK